MMNSKIRTVREAVDALGGTGATADFCDVVPSAVSNWLHGSDPQIPRAYHLMIYLQLEELGHEVDVMSLFRMPVGKVGRFHERVSVTA